MSCRPEQNASLCSADRGPLISARHNESNRAGDPVKGWQSASVLVWEWLCGDLGRGAEKPEEILALTLSARG